MSSEYEGSLKGQFLISMPAMADPNFSQTVTCVCEHNPEGAVGLVVNRILPAIAAKDIFEELKLEYTPESAILPIHAGGPVHLNEVFVLHGPPLEWEASLPVTARLSLSNTMDILRAVAMGEGPPSVIIAVGCAGWGPMQLEAEIKQNAWLNGPVNESLLFEIDVDDRWTEAVKQLGIDPSLLSDSAGHA